MQRLRRLHRQVRQVVSHHRETQWRRTLVPVQITPDRCGGRLLTTEMQVLENRQSCQSQQSGIGVFERLNERLEPSGLFFE